MDNFHIISRKEVLVFSNRNLILPFLLLLLNQGQKIRPVLILSSQLLLLTMQNKIIRNKMFYVRHTVYKRYARVEREKTGNDYIDSACNFISDQIGTKPTVVLNLLYYTPHQYPLLTAIHAILVPWGTLQYMVQDLHTANIYCKSTSSIQHPFFSLH